MQNEPTMTKITFFSPNQCNENKNGLHPEKYTCLSWGITFPMEKGRVEVVGF